MRRHDLSFFGAAICATLFLAPVSLATTSLRVEVTGLGGEPRTNVLSALTIDDVVDRDDLDEATIRRLHAAAPREIARALEPFGLYRPQIEATLEPGEGGWTATYTVEPGEPARVTTLEIALLGDGLGDARFANLVETFPLAVGDALVHPRYEAGKQAFLDVAASDGYFDARFTTNAVVVDLDEDRVDIDLTFDTGPRFAFGEVTFQQSVLRPEILQSYVPFAPGAPFRTADLAVLQRSLENSGLWSRVTIVPRRDQVESGEPVPIEVTLTPRPRRRDTGGLGYATDSGPRVSGSMEFRRLNRSGHRGQIDLRVAEVDRSFGLRYEIPRAETERGLLRFEAGFTTIEPDSHDDETAFVGTSLTRLRGAWRQTFSLRLERHDFTVASDRGTVSFLAPGVSLSRTRADDPLVPRRGSRIDIALRAGAEGALSDVTFGRLYARGKLVRSLAPRVRLLGRIEAGSVLSDDFADLPPSLRFFAGGDSSVRGFGYLDLGPRDATGAVRGGKRLLTASLELELKVLQQWGVAAFYDAGNAFDDFGDRLERGAGVGLRWFSPIGLVRADVAWAVSVEGTPARLHLGLGIDL